MQTFIIDSDPVVCAKLLDYKRLGKQRVEAMQILNIIKENRLVGGWVNHPCVKMWKDYPKELGYYMNVMIDEWISRGFKNTMQYATDTSSTMPLWFHMPELIYSHQSALIHKDYKFYTNKFDVKYLYDNQYLERGYVWDVKSIPVIFSPLKYDINILLPNIKSLIDGTS